MPSLNITSTVTTTTTINTKFGKGDTVLVKGMSFPRPKGAFRRLDFEATITDVKATKKKDGGYSVKYTVKGNRYGKVHVVPAKQLKLIAGAGATPPSR